MTFDVFRVKRILDSFEFWELAEQLRDGVEALVFGQEGITEAGLLQFGQFGQAVITDVHERSQYIQEILKRIPVFSYQRQTAALQPRQMEVCFQVWY